MLILNFSKLIANNLTIHFLVVNFLWSGYRLKIRESKVSIQLLKMIPLGFCNFPRKVIMYKIVGVKEWQWIKFVDLLIIP